MGEGAGADAHAIIEAPPCPPPLPPASQALNEALPRPPHLDWPKLTVAGKQDESRKMQAVTWQGKHSVSICLGLVLAVGRQDRP